MAASRQFSREFQSAAIVGDRCENKKMRITEPLGQIGNRQAKSNDPEA